MIVTASFAALGLAVATAVVASAVNENASASGTTSSLASRSDAVSAQSKARASQKQVEVEGARTETAQTFANPDGSFTTEIADGPVRVRQDDGSWRDLDLDLFAGADGLTQKASPAPVTFSDGGSGPMATLTVAGRNLEMHWPGGNLPEPKIEGNVATYAVSDSEDLVLTATRTGFEQSLVLKEPPAEAPVVSLPLSLDGLDVDANDKGGYVFSATEASGTGENKVDAGDVVAAVAEPVMYSAAVDKIGEPTQVEVLKSTLGEAAQGGDAELTLKPGPSGMDFLNDPGTVYPVTIDPVVATLDELGDNWIQNGSSTTQFSSPYLATGLQTAATRSLVRFTTDPIIGQHVTSASLRLWQHVSNTCTAKTTYAYPISETYTNTSVVWSNQPAIDTSTSYRGSGSFSWGFDTSCNRAFGTVDVTEMVKGWATGAIPSHGIELRAASESDTSSAKSFCSFDSPATGTCATLDRVPTLSVTYNANTVPTLGALEVDPSVEGDSGRITSSDTPMLSAEVADADGDALNVTFAVYPQTGSTALAQTTVTGVASGETAQWTLPKGTLAMGNTYRWRASVADATDSSGWGSLQPLRLSEPTYVAPTSTAGLTEAQVNSVVSALDQPVIAVQATVATADDGTALTVGINSDDGILGTDLMTEVSATLDDMADDAATAPAASTISAASTDQSAAANAETLSLVSNAKAAVAAGTVTFDKIVVAQTPATVPSGVTTTQDATHAEVTSAYEEAGNSGCTGTYKPNLMESRVATSKVKGQRRAVLQFWFTQARLNQLLCIDGGRTTFEPDLTTYNYDGKHYFSKKIKSWSTSMPKGYKDTAFADKDEERTYTIGTSHADKLKPNTWYTTYFRATNGNSSTDTGKVYSQRGRRKISLCDSTWCIFGRDNNHSIEPWEAALPGTTTRGTQP